MQLPHAPMCAPVAPAVNRKRIRAIRKELEKKGWASVGF